MKQKIFKRKWMLPKDFNLSIALLCIMPLPSTLILSYIYLFTPLFNEINSIVIGIILAIGFASSIICSIIGTASLLVILASIKIRYVEVKE